MTEFQELLQRIRAAAAAEDAREASNIAPKRLEEMRTEYRKARSYADMVDAQNAANPAANYEYPQRIARILQDYQHIMP